MIANYFGVVIYGFAMFTIITLRLCDSDDTWHKTWVFVIPTLTIVIVEGLMFGSRLMIESKIRVLFDVRTAELIAEREGFVIREHKHEEMDETDRLMQS